MFLPRETGEQMRGDGAQSLVCGAVAEQEEASAGSLKSATWSKWGAN